jgi:dolichyl-phosphate beta-glucosyltransferase
MPDERKPTRGLYAIFEGFWSYCLKFPQAFSALVPVECNPILLMPPILSIVIPAYNESARLGKSLEIIFRYLIENYPESEVIVVDDGSTDDTIAVAERGIRESHGISASVIPVKPNRGKGFAVRTGLLAAKGAIGLFTDADLSTPIEETKKLVDEIEMGDFDVVFGSRAIDRSLIGVHQPWRREQGGRLFNLVVRVATGMPFWDTQCGFKAFRMATCRPFLKAARVDRFGFDVELLYLARITGLKLEEKAVRWDHNDGSKLSVVKDSLKAFDEVRTIRSFEKRGYYDEAVQETKAILQARREHFDSSIESEAPEREHQLTGTSRH